jgi:uncharacterized protein (DUF924 family)
LNFWFGEGVFGTDRARDKAILLARNPLWWGMKPDFSGPASPEEMRTNDNACKEFVPAMDWAAAVAGQYDGDDGEGGWNSDVGLYAKMILTDQLTRNAFRGTAKAFEYDSAAVKYARELFRRGAHDRFDAAIYFTFLATPGQHSESLSDHVMNEAIVATLEAKEGSEEAGMLKDHVTAHKAVIGRFGRYPWRNDALGRESSNEEKAYMDDYDNLPQFAKSQMMMKKKT